MEVVNNTINHINNLPKIKKIILVIMVVVVILFILDIVNTYYNNKQKYTNINTKKISNKIENMDSQAVNNTQTNDDDTPFVVGDVTLHPSKTNVTLYFAEWCGHCKQFMKTTWNQVQENYGNSSNISLNKVDCTNTKTEIKTAAGKTIQGFPTVIINYKNADGEYIEEEYNGGRSYSVFTAYLEKLSA
jgi:thiol-disulfide isomerase/thioredoxin